VDIPMDNSCYFLTKVLRTVAGALGQNMAGGKHTANQGGGGGAEKKARGLGKVGVTGAHAAWPTWTTSCCSSGAGPRRSRGLWMPSKFWPSWG